MSTSGSHMLHYLLCNENLICYGNGTQCQNEIMEKIQINTC